LDSKEHFCKTPQNIGLNTYKIALVCICNIWNNKNNFLYIENTIQPTILTKKEYINPYLDEKWHWSGLVARWLDGFPIVKVKFITSIVGKCEQFWKNETSMIEELLMEEYAWALRDIATFG
jgi:hypothetical protein